MRRLRSLNVPSILALALISSACQDTGVEFNDIVGPRFAKGVPNTQGLTAMEALGKAIYFDKELSLHRNQSCASCHAPAFGFSGPNPGINLRGTVYQGSVRYRFGNRRPPTSSYAAQAPVLYYDAGDDVWVGGNFWDGRATGWTLGFPAAEQALGPFLNPVEQALPDEICVLYRIAEGPYADMWTNVWGEDLRDLNFPSELENACRREGAIEYGEELRAAVMAAYEQVGLAVNEFESSSEVNPFSSKFDAVMNGEASFTEEEAMGFFLFQGKAMCSACHISEGEYPLFTDYTYDNLGIPANPLNPVYEEDPNFVDYGLGGFLASIDDPRAESFMGAVKVPTLRNVAARPGTAVKAYGHNGVFKSLEQIVHFYNTRDVLRECGPGEVLPTAAGLAKVGFEPECWPAPEVDENVNVDELGDLGLTSEEEGAIVAFMKTLSDGWR